jgi:TPR repeat protein
MQLAAAHGDAETECNLAILYQKGTGLPQSYEDARAWFQMAAEQGFVTAQHNLGALYGNGQGTTKNLVEAYKWLSLAEQGGYKDTQHALELLKPQMTSEQIVEAQRLADAWNTAHPRQKSR